jgi:transposase
MRKVLGSIYTDEDFADLFPKEGQPAQAPWRLALVTVMQFVENLSDRQTADAVRGRIDWKYLLGLELTDPGFDASVLSEFRARLINQHAEELLLERMLTLFGQKGWLKARGRQRTDSTHVLAKIRALNRVLCVWETMRAALGSLAVVAPDWLRAHSQPEWVERYGPRNEDSRSPLGEAERLAFAEEIGQQGRELLDAVFNPTAPEWLRQVPAVEILTPASGCKITSALMIWFVGVLLRIFPRHLDISALLTMKRLITARSEARHGLATKSI